MKQLVALVVAGILAVIAVVKNADWIDGKAPAVTPCGPAVEKTAKRVVL